MYMQSYSKEDDVLKVPEGYGGTAFIRDSEPQPPPRTVYTEPERRDIKISCGIDTEDKNQSEEDATEAIANENSPSLSKRLRQIYKSYHLPKLDLEDLLLIAIAAFILLSKNEDIECAIMLLILVFIK